MYYTRPLNESNVVTPIKLVPYFAWGNRGHIRNVGLVTGKQIV